MDDFLRSLVLSLREEHWGLEKVAVIAVGIAVIGIALLIVQAGARAVTAGIQKAIQVVLLLFIGAFAFHGFFSTHCFTVVRSNPCSSAHCSAVATVDKITPESFRKQYKEKGLPVKMSSLVPARFLKQFHPEAMIRQVQQVGEHWNVTLQCGTAEQGQTRLLSHDLISFLLHLDKEIPGCVRPYLSEDDFLSTIVKRQVDDVASIIVGDHAVFNLNFFFVGGKGTRTGLHKDPDTLSVLHQLYGEKTVTLFQPSDDAFLYPSDKFDNGATLSRIDVFDDSHDIAKGFPLFSKAQPLKVHLQPGDALFIPYGWWHYAEATTASISLASRAYTLCEIISFLPLLFEITLHSLYPHLIHSSCTCHNSSAEAA